MYCLRDFIGYLIPSFPTKRGGAGGGYTTRGPYFTTLFKKVRDHLQGPIEGGPGMSCKGRV